MGGKREIYLAHQGTPMTTSHPYSCLHITVRKLPQDKELVGLPHSRISDPTTYMHLPYAADKLCIKTSKLEVSKHERNL